MADICVMGLGYVGLPTASLLANGGFHVLGVDIDARIVEGLKNGTTRLEEPGLATLVSAAVNSGNLIAATRPEPSDVFVICVPTPVTAKQSVDLSMVEGAARSIVPNLRKGNLVILESTSPIGTTRNVVGKIIKEAGFEPGSDVFLCYCPERVLPGNTASELINNDRIIGGVTPESAQNALYLYERFCQGRISLTDDRTAEMCKLMENTYRDVNIALANSFARIAEDAGVNVWDAIQFANLHPRVKILKPGPGVGGHCIPVDPWFLVEAYPQHGALLRTAREVNDGQAAHILKRMIATGLLKSGEKLAILGAAYKADIDDARESPATLLNTAGLAHGLRVAVHDPLVKPDSHHGLPVSSDLAACLKDASAAVLLTEHKQYRNLSSKTFADNMKGRLIADARNWLNHASLRKAGFTVLLVGAANP